jgi:hypothetical protein
MVMRERRIAALVAAFLAFATPVAADVSPAPGMLSNAANAQVPTARNNLGAGPGNGINVVTDYGADPTGVADSTVAFQNAVNAACNTPATANLTRGIFLPAGNYLVSGTIDYYGGFGCDIGGQGTALFLIPPEIDGTVIIAASSMTTGDIFRNRGLGQIHYHDLSITTPYEIATDGGGSAPPMTGSMFYVRSHAGGTGYAVNDTITLTGGTFTTAAILKVTHVTGGAVDGVGVQNAGAYTIIPSAVAPVAQGSTSGSGTGATFDVILAGSAAISLSGPEGVIATSAASGATTITVDRVAPSFITAVNGGSGDVQVELDNGTYQSVPLISSTGTTITIGAGLTFPASAGRHVYPQFGYAQRPLLSNVVVSGTFDGVFIENAAFVRTDNLTMLDYMHDGLHKVNGPTPDQGVDDYDNIYAWDFVVGTSNAGVEINAGGDIKIVAPKFLASNYSILLNIFWHTGTLLVGDGSLEESTVCSIRLHQAVSGVEYANVSIVGNELSNIMTTSAQHLCVDTGTPTSQPKWIGNIVFNANHTNDYVTAAVSSINVQDGNNVTIQGNVLNNNGAAGPTGIAIGGNATNVVEAGNEISGFPTGKYGTMQASSLDAWRASGPVLSQVLDAAKTSNYALLASDSGIHFDNTAAAGEVDFTLPTYAAGLRYCFTVTAAQTLKVIAPASNKIAVGALNSAAAGNITASAVYANACLYATSVSNQWAAEATTGTWTVN